jgi:hypothetical protein
VHTVEAPTIYFAKVPPQQQQHAQLLEESFPRLLISFFISGTAIDHFHSHPSLNFNSKSSIYIPGTWSKLAFLGSALEDLLSVWGEDSFFLKKAGLHFSFHNLLR